MVSLKVNGERRVQLFFTRCYTGGTWMISFEVSDTEFSKICTPIFCMYLISVREERKREHFSTFSQKKKWLLLKHTL
jgi:hypothetical protein